MGALMTMMETERSLLNGEIVRERTKMDKCRHRFFEAQTEFDQKQRSENDK